MIGDTINDFLTAKKTGMRFLKFNFLYFFKT